MLVGERTPPKSRRILNDSFFKVAVAYRPIADIVAAAPAAAVDLGSGFSVGGGATLVSDYRFRGISQTDKRFAVQGTFTLSHSSGFYATWWGSSIDDYIASGSDAENDLIFGYKKTFKSTTIDGGVLYYYYPGGCCGVPTDFAEPYLKVTQAFGPSRRPERSLMRRSKRRSASAMARKTISTSPATLLIPFRRLRSA